MGLLAEWMRSKQAEAIRFVEPAPAVPTYEQRAAALAAAEVERAVLGANGGSIRPRRTASADEIRQADEGKAAVDETEKTRAEMAALQAKIDVAERAAVDRQRAEAQLAADVKARLDNSKKVRREEKKARKKGWKQ